MAHHKNFSLFRVESLHHTNRKRAFCLLLLLQLVVSGTVVYADWPEFRGPSGDGHVPTSANGKTPGLPLQWSETNNVKWKTEIPFRGWSAPVILGDQVWVSTATEDGHDF